MWRALAKGAGLAAVAQLPGGAAVYRRLTRELMGTQRGHVDKLRRAWPHYAELWQRSLPLEGARLWIHEGAGPPSPSWRAGSSPVEV